MERARSTADGFTVPLERCMNSRPSRHIVGAELQHIDLHGRSPATLGKRQANLRRSIRFVRSQPFEQFGVREVLAQVPCARELPSFRAGKPRPRNNVAARDRLVPDALFPAKIM
jgi:hypothetical protein